MIDLDTFRAEAEQFQHCKTVFQGSPERLDQLESEKDIKLPPEFSEYIKSYIPVRGGNSQSQSPGNPKYLYRAKELSWTMPGYNYNTLKKERIESWDNSWFLFADENADPFIIKIDEHAKFSPVYMAYHGMGGWMFDPIADSVGQFLLCAAAMHETITMKKDRNDVLLETGEGYDLADESAKFLFPYIRKVAPDYYDYWLAGIDNR